MGSDLYVAGSIRYHARGTGNALPVISSTAGNRPGVLAGPLQAQHLLIPAHGPVDVGDR